MNRLASVAALVCVAMVACGGGRLAAVDGDAGDAAVGAEAGPSDATAPDADAGEASTDARADATDATPNAPDASDASDAADASDGSDGATLTQLAPPSFSPQPGFFFGSSVSVAILPPPGFPDSGVILYGTDLSGKLQPPTTPYTAPITVTGEPTCNGPPSLGSIAAKATAPGYVDSIVVTGTWTAAIDLPPPAFNPTSQSSNQDFTVSMTAISSGSSDTGCYRLDGNTPTCAKGTCTGGSFTYDPSKTIPIDGSVTDPTTGKVTITAVLCDSCGDVTNVFTQVYQLIVADPVITMQATPGTATVTTVTVPSNEPLTMHMTTGATLPTCITGTALVGSTASIGPFAAGTTVHVIACKPGYLHSNVVTATF